MDGGGDSDTADSQYDSFSEAEFFGGDAYYGGFSAYVQQEEEIAACHAV